MGLTDEQQKAMQKQIEFYFSDVNVAKDVFLKTKMAESAEGFVPLAVLLTFNRVNKITKDEKEVMEAIKGSELLVVDEETMSVRRKNPLPESIQTDNETIYAKPIPAAATLEDLQAFFGKFGTVRAVWRRYFPGGKDKSSEARTKPSVFVVFASQETVEALKKDPPTYEGCQLLVQSKTEYLERKAVELAAKAKSKKVPAAGGEPTAVAAEGARKTTPMPRGASATVTAEEKIEGFKAVKGMWPLEEQKGVRYIFMPSETTAQVIFQDKETADKMLEDLNTRGTTLNGKLPKVERIAGDDEESLLTNVEKEISERAVQNAGRGGGGGRGRGGRGGRGGGRGGRGRGGKRPRQD